VLAIFLSCFGLFGLVSFIIERRTKEIGIRKVLGASVFEIIALFARGFTKQIILANLFAWAARLFFHEQMASEFCLSSKYRIFNFYSSQRSFLFCFSYNDIFTDLQSSGSQSGEKYQK